MLAAKDGAGPRPRAAFRMNRISRFLASTIGAKVGMAVTGLLLALFVVAHLIGNLLVFAGRGAMNDYAEMLQHLGVWLWVARLGLLALFLTHVALALSLAARNRAARPIAYAKAHTIQASAASRTMVLSGLLVLAFVAMHLAHFTLGWLEPAKYALTETLRRDGVELVRHDVYGMLVAGFRNDVFVLLYVAAMVVLGLHLSHGISSLFQSLGLRHPGYVAAVRLAGRGLAIVLAFGFITIPLAVRFGIVGA